MTKIAWWMTGVLAFIVLVLVAFIGVIFPVVPETVSPTQFQNYQGEVNEKFSRVDSDISTMVYNVTALTTAVNGGFTQVREGYEKDRENDAKLQESDDKLKAEQAGRQTDALNARIAQLEKDSARTPGQYQNAVNFFVSQSGSYRLTIIPSDAEVFLDGRAIIDQEIVYLTHGWHSYWLDSKTSVISTPY